MIGSTHSPSNLHRNKQIFYLVPSGYIWLFLSRFEGECAEPIMAWLCAGHSTTLTHLHASSKYSSMALERVGSIGLGPSETIFTELAWEGEAGGSEIGCGPLP